MPEQKRRRNKSGTAFRNRGISGTNPMRTIQKSVLDDMPEHELLDYIYTRLLSTKGNGELILGMHDLLHKAADKGNAAAKMTLVEIYSTEKRYDEAISLLKDLVNEPNYRKEALERLAGCYFMLEKNEEALELYEHIAREYPENADVMIVLGNIYYKKFEAGEKISYIDDACRYFKKGVELKPNVAVNTINYLKIAKIAAVLKDSKINITLQDVLDEIEKYAPRLPPEQVSLLRARTYRELGETEKYEIEIKKTVEEIENYGGNNLTGGERYEAYLYAGEIAFGESDYETALKYFKKSANQAPSRNIPFNSIAVCLYRLDRYEESAEYCKKAIAQCPDEPVFYDNYIQACKEANITDGVLEMGRKLAKLKLQRALAPLRHEAELLDENGKKFSVVISPISAGVIKGIQSSKPMLGQDRLPHLIEASIDLKVTADGKVKIIEFNDMYSSGFDGFKRAYGTEMREDHVYPYHDFLQEKRSKEYGEFEIIKPTKSKSRLEHMIKAATSEGDEVFTSATLPWWAVNERKDYMHLTTPLNWAHLFPKTLVMPRSHLLKPSEVEARIKRITTLDINGASLADKNYIVKPCDDSIGRGVELVSGKDIVNHSMDIMRGEVDEDSYWNGRSYPNFLIQECVHSRPVLADNGKEYDATMRIAFTAELSPDRKSMISIRFHDAYWKLPCRSIDDKEDPRNAVVSFPPSSLSKIANEAFAADFPVSAKVSTEDKMKVATQLLPYLRDVLPRYGIRHDQYHAQLSGMLSRRSDAHRVLGAELSTLFLNAACFELLIGGDSHTALINRAEGLDAPAKSATANYLDYLFNAPLQSGAHAAALANRSLPLLEKRLGITETVLEETDFFEAVREMKDSGPAIK